MKRTIEAIVAELEAVAAKAQISADPATEKAQYAVLEKELEAALADQEEEEARKTKLAGLQDRAAKLAADKENSLRAELNAKRQTNAGTPNVNGRIPAQARRDDPNGDFRDGHEFFTAVMNWNRGISQDNRLVPFLTAGSDEARGNSDPAGGFLFPRGFLPNLLQITPEDDPTAGRTRSIPMDTAVLDIPARVDTTHTSSVSGGLTFTRRPETVAGSPSQMTLSQVSLKARNLFGLSYATEEVLNRSPISFIAILTQGFNQQYGAHMLNEKLNGTGTGEYVGVMAGANACLVTVNKESGQSATTIVKENIDKMRSRCWGYGRSIWLAHYDTYPQLASLSQVVGIGGAPVPYLSADMSGQPMLSNRPIFFTEFCQTLGTTGDIILGNWGEYLEGTLTPMQNAESMHVRFVNHERVFKFWTENDGQPWWKAALTPKNGSNTLSPFVALQTR